MKNHLRRLGQLYVWHFTDKRNLPYIRAIGGLLPRSKITGPYFPGGNKWSIEADDLFGMNDYVHLCFLAKHPMEYLAREEGRIDPTWLRISTNVLSLPGVKYCAGVANRAGALLLDNQEAIDTLDFNYMYGYHNFTIAENRDLHNATQKYEILVPAKIPLKMITDI